MLRTQMNVSAQSDHSGIFEYIKEVLPSILSKNCGTSGVNSMILLCVLHKVHKLNTQCEGYVCCLFLYILFSFDTTIWTYKVFVGV
jgi:hypothetical protein